VILICVDVSLNTNQSLNQSINNQAFTLRNLGAIESVHRVHKYSKQCNINVAGEREHVTWVMRVWVERITQVVGNLDSSLDYHQIPENPVLEPCMQAPKWLTCVRLTTTDDERRWTVQYMRNNRGGGKCSTMGAHFDWELKRVERRRNQGAEGVGSAEKGLAAANDFSRF